MYDYIWKLLEKREKPIDVIVAGLGFMGFGFVSAVRNVVGMRVPLLISRRPKESKKYLEERGFKVKIESNPQKIKDFADKGYICVSDDLSLIETYENEVVLEMTGTVAYGTEIGLQTIKARKHFMAYMRAEYGYVADRTLYRVNKRRSKGYFMNNNIN